MQTSPSRGKSTNLLNITERERRKEFYMNTNKLTDKQTATKNNKQANKPRCRASLVSDLGKKRKEIG